MKISVVVFVVCGLVGCGQSPQCCDVAAVAGQEGSSDIASGLTATSQQFLGPLDPSTGGGIGLGPDTLSPGGATPYRKISDRRVGLRLELRQPIAPKTSGFFAVEASRGGLRYRLPQGVGILSDPARIGFDSLALTPEIGLTRQIALTPEISLQLSVSAGQRRAKLRTQFSSALIDITNTSIQTADFVSLEASLRRAPPEKPTRSQELALAVRRYGDTSLSVQSTLRFWH